MTGTRHETTPDAIHPDERAHWRAIVAGVCGSLGQDGADVVLHRLLGQKQPLPDLPVGQPLSDQLQDPACGGRRMLRRRVPSVPTPIPRAGARERAGIATGAAWSARGAASPSPGGGAAGGGRLLERHEHGVRGGTGRVLWPRCGCPESTRARVRPAGRARLATFQGPQHRCACGDRAGRRDGSLATANAALFSHRRLRAGTRVDEHGAIVPELGSPPSRAKIVHRRGWRGGLRVAHRTERFGVRPGLCARTPKRAGGVGTLLTTGPKARIPGGPHG